MTPMQLRPKPLSNLGADEASNNNLIDNVARHPTPEGLMLTLMPAGFSPRLSAWLMDLAIRFLAIIIMSIAFSILGIAGEGLIAIGMFIISWLYPVFFEVYREGMTPGKKSQGIYVCHDDGTPITIQASMIRNLLRVADFLPFGFVAGVISMMFNRQSQRIGDMVAGTLVVYQQKDDIEKLYNSIYGFVKNQPDLPASPYSQQPNTQNNLSVYDPASPLFFFPLTLNEQQALVSYSERIPFLSKERQIEIAYHLSPLVNVNNATPTVIREAVYQAVIKRSAMIVGAPVTLNSAQNAQANTMSGQQTIQQRTW